VDDGLVKIDDERQLPRFEKPITRLGLEPLGFLLSASTSSDKAHAGGHRDTRCVMRHLKAAWVS
jgi:hypothetical protein